jgi:hypothetical protein
MDLYSSSPDLAIPNPMLLQHLYLGLSEKSTQFLDIALGGAFLHLSVSEGRAILDTILENSPYTNVHDDSLEEKDIPTTPVQEKEVLIVKPLPIPSKGLTADPIPKPFLGTPTKEEIRPLEFPFEFKDDLFPNVRNILNHPIQQISLAPLANQHILNPPQVLVAQEPLEPKPPCTSDINDPPFIPPCFFVDNPNQGGTPNLLVDVEWEHKSSEAKILILIKDEDGNPLIECHIQKMMDEYGKR